jgi:hypothetical protein
MQKAFNYLDISFLKNVWLALMVVISTSRHPFLTLQAVGFHSL